MRLMKTDKGWFLFFSLVVAEEPRAVHMGDRVEVFIAVFIYLLFTFIFSNPQFLLVSGCLFLTAQHT